MVLRIKAILWKSNEHIRIEVGGIFLNNKKKEKNYINGNNNNDNNNKKYIKII